jgi:hypothetical protein
MEPDVIGARILDGIRENRANIFTHPDHKDELREIMDEILADYRDYPPDEGHDRRSPSRRSAARISPRRGARPRSLG